MSAVGHATSVRIRRCRLDCTCFEGTEEGRIKGLVKGRTDPLVGRLQLEDFNNQRCFHIGDEVSFIFLTSMSTFWVDVKERTLSELFHDGYPQGLC